MSTLLGLNDADEFLETNGAADELQICSAQQSDGNHQTRQSQVSRRPNTLAAYDMTRRASLMR
eukprot:3834588-Pyramimonas_sp.AAC.1